MVALFLSCSYFLGNRRDSLTSLEEEAGQAQYSQSIRQWRRGIPTTVGVKREGLPIKDTATSGYRWKKKWRERKARSKAVKQQTFSSSSSFFFLFFFFPLSPSTVVQIIHSIHASVAQSYVINSFPAKDAALLFFVVSSRNVPQSSETDEANRKRPFSDLCSTCEFKHLQFKQERSYNYNDVLSANEKHLAKDVEIG